MLEQDLRTLNARIDSLIQKIQVVTAENARLRAAAGEVQSLRAKVEALTAENNSLRAKETALAAERDELSRKNDLARARVEAIILRLKALETPEA
jgi:cell division protein ZapB